MSLERLQQDLRLAWRGLAAARGFTTAAVLTLVVGVAGTTVMFTLVQGVLLRPLPVPGSGSARRRVEGAAGGRRALAVRAAGARRDWAREPDVRRRGWSQLLRCLRELATERGATLSINGAMVSGAFFEVLGVRPVLGRTLNVRDDLEGAEPVIVITHGLWQRRYGGSRDVIGRRIGLDERTFTSSA